MRIFKVFLSTVMLGFLLSGCSESEPPSPERYRASDTLMKQLEANVTHSPHLQKIVEIDHSRLGYQAGSVMPPARVLIFSNVAVDTALIQQNPLTAVDLPLRVLAYEAAPNGDSKVIYNSFDYLRSRYRLPVLPAVERQYTETLGTVLEGINPQQIAAFSKDKMTPDGIITLTSPYDFQTTKDKVMAAIESQDDTVSFGEVDFQARAKGINIEINPSTLILFGGPAPGAKAMSAAPTLGLDAFCQKFLVWQSDSGQVNLSFNDLLAIADRQGVSKSIPLRVINYRLNSVFEAALE
jgi:uncharacterized protein (DUF302 family)